MPIRRLLCHFDLFLPSSVSASLVSAEGVYSGKIVIKSKNSQFKVTVPYRASVLQGSLLLDEECTHFFLPDIDNNGKGTAGMTREAKRAQGKLERNISVTNDFSVPVVVHRVTLGKGGSGGGKREAKYFNVQQMGPVILMPGDKVPVVKLVLRPGAWNDRTLDSVLTLHTNVSSIVVPLLVFHGKMDTVSFDF